MRWPFELIISLLFTLFISALHPRHAQFGRRDQRLLFAGPSLSDFASDPAPMTYASINNLLIFFREFRWIDSLSLFVLLENWWKIKEIEVSTLMWCFSCGAKTAVLSWMDLGCQNLGLLYWFIIFWLLVSKFAETGKGKCFFKSSSFFFLFGLS